MSNMEFLKANFVNTTTQMSVSTGGTSTVSNLFNRFTSKKFGSGDASDATTTTIQIDFVSTQTVDRIILQNHNFKSFTIYKGGATASVITIQNALTATTAWTTNSATSHYLIFDSATALTQINIDISTTIDTNEEKQLGEVWITANQFTFDRNPSARNYTPAVNRKEFPVSMSDGGTDLYIVQDNFMADIRMKFISSTEHTSLRTIYDLDNHFVFTPEPTGTAWNNEIFAVNWIGKFDLQWTKDFKGTGFNQRIKMREISK